ncbi:Predicted ribonuclease, toxin component of the YeeF-YezG toxin-antitoxin module [Paenisporosarcina quisquiliarum]|nr:Predicted ribonuclease, toxin component of the YeeF-YezG toxin-antitoxin module [Paenisporosarcina quisquiliarum]
MKILDVDLFQDGIQRNITMLDRLSSEMKAIHHAVEGLVQMEDQLKGAGGNAIRSFYQECHLPFLHFFQLFSEQFKQVLNQMEAALHSLEPDSSGYILETFLEGELEQGLTLISELTASLTDEANSIMDQVSDIVALPHLDDSGVQEGVISSKRKRDDTLMQLYEFDALQTYALNPIEQGLQTMDTWLTDMEGLFQAGVKDINFLPSQWDVLTFRSDIRTELFPKVFLDPNYLWVREQEQLIGAMITAPTFQAMHGKKVKTIEENVAENVKYHAYDNGLLIKEYVVGQTVFYEVVSKVEYKEEETVKVDKPKENKILDSLQFGLDIAGLIPVVGEIADGANGLIYTARGDALNATLSFSAMIPVVGMASTGGKLAVKGSKAIEEAQDASKAVDNVNDGAKGIDNANRLIPGTPGNPTSGDPTKLGKNLLESMGLPRSTSWKGYQAQHIIPSQLNKHPVIKEIGIEMNDSTNGIFLPIPSDDVSSLSRHRGFHSVYNNVVRKQLDKMDVNQDIAVLEKQVYELQQKLKMGVENGLPLYKTKINNIEEFYKSGKNKNLPVWNRGGGATEELWERWLSK